MNEQFKSEAVLSIKQYVKGQVRPMGYNDF